MKKIALTAFFIALILIQFYQPEKNESTITPPTDIVVMTAPPKPIEALLKNTCYDCHSNNTRYPWYANIVPVSYFLADHVKDGKKHLDFSVWGDYTSKKQKHKLEELIDEVSERKMPLKSYTWLHRDAKLSEEEIQLLTGWANELMASYPPAAE